MRSLRASVQPKAYCANCKLATLYPDGTVRCDFTKNGNLLGVCVQPNSPACQNVSEGKFKIYKVK